MRNAASLLIVSAVISCSVASASAAYSASTLYTLQGTFGTTYDLYLPNVYSGPRLAVGGRLVGTTVSPDREGHALLWNASGGPVDLHPANTAFFNTYPTAVGGSQQVGIGSLNSPGGSISRHAVVWDSSAATIRDLHPAGRFYSTAYGTNGRLQVGEVASDGFDGAFNHAALWAGTAASRINLHPGGGAIGSIAYATTDARQVGSVTYNPDPEVGLTVTNAVVWSGSAGSMVNLQPAAWPYSTAYGLTDDQQVGVAFTYNLAQSHAFLWTGSAASALDLHPAGYGSSIAYGTDGITQVGHARTLDGEDHAFVWAGSAGAAVDLHNLLPGDPLRSYATAIEGGTIYGIAELMPGTWSAVSWSVPEPTMAVPLALVATALVRRRRA